MSEEPYIPFYKPYGMTDEEYRYEVKKAEERHAEWEAWQDEQIEQMLKHTEGHVINGDDMDWIVNCPECDKEYHFTGFFDKTDKTNCKCGCTFVTDKVWINDKQFIQ